ncbi:MAG: M48 family metallopeptidase [bacterium]|nr:M48 family metallopeptidase [bacterium]
MNPAPEYPDYIIHFDRKFRGGYRLGVTRENRVEIIIGDRKNENQEFAEGLIRKHRRFVNRRLRLNEARGSREIPPEPDRRTALRKLTPIFEAITQEMGMPLWKLTVRRANTRWGSCSHHTRRIMLNLRAAQLPPELTRYLIVHELAHIHHRGHGPDFWTLVERFDPEYKRHRKILREEYGALL